MTSEIKEFNKLYTDYYGLFVRFARTYILDEEDAEDIVMEGLIYYWENRGKLTDQSNIPAYILETIKHKCLNYLRHQRVREETEQYLTEHQTRVNNLRIATLEACDPQEIFSNEAQRLIQEALNSLPEKTREIFILSRYEGNSYQEIAKQYSLSVKSVEFHISKALKILRAKLKDYLMVFSL